MRALRNLTALGFLGGTLLSGACSQTPNLVNVRSMERPKDVDFICLHHDEARDSWEGASLEKCNMLRGSSPERDAVPKDYPFSLHAVVTQTSRGELAVVNVGQTPRDAAGLVKVDPRVPGFSFLPVGAVPTDVVADQFGKAVYVSSGKAPRIDIIPASLLRGPIDTTAEQLDETPWPHIELDAQTDGIASAMTIVREGKGRKLFVVLPDAGRDKDGKVHSKIAVFDLGDVSDDPKADHALAPIRLPDVVLDSSIVAPDLDWAPLGCGPAVKDATGVWSKATTPWWTAYDACFGAVPASSTGKVPSPTVADTRLAGVAVAGGMLFAGDDKAPIIHVFNLKTGREERRIAVGSPVSQLAVSPAVPDEVDIHTVRGVDLCQSNKWLGDGLDHSSNATIQETLGGRCRLHRYIYAVDSYNTVSGNGAIAVIDLPVTYAPGMGGLDRTAEKIDFDAARLVQPMGCDSPSFASTRLPLNSILSAPARSVAFLTIDPPTGIDHDLNGLTRPSAEAARCRAWDALDENGNVTAQKHPDGQEFEGALVPDDVQKRITSGVWWRTQNQATSLFLRGTFAFVLMQNGSLDIVDVDDYDATCRGPKPSTAQPKPPLFASPSGPDVSPGDGATGDFYARIVSRHHPRSYRNFDGQLLPGITTPALSQFGLAQDNNPASTTNGANRPHFAVLAYDKDNQAIFAVPSADNPYSVSADTWTVTYEGQLPGYSGTFGALSVEGGVLTLTDATGAFCRRGVEDNGDPKTHDAVQLVEDVCPADRPDLPDQPRNCRGTKFSFARCREIFGDGTEHPLHKQRTLYIQKAFDGKVTLAPLHWSIDPKGNPELLDGYDLEALDACFGVGNITPNNPPSLHRYVVRATGSWVVNGAATGYLHRRIIDPASGAEKACIDDVTRPHIYDGRVRKELPKLGKDDKFADPLPKEAFCQRFQNPSWAFAIRSGQQPSQQDMQFMFLSKGIWSPFLLGVGPLPQSVTPVQASWDGQIQFDWGMIATVDAVEKGLLMFAAQRPFSPEAPPKGAY